MRSPRRLPRESFRLSAVFDNLNVSHRRRDERAVHTAFAIALTEVDHRLDDQVAKRDVEAAIVQAWDYFASERS